MSEADVDAFFRHLREIDQDWSLIEQLNDQRARLRFTGPFQGRTVIWDCEFVTLVEAQSQRNFIDVGSPQSAGIPLHVGLSIAHIDVPAIKKMIHMIRHYKHLCSGRHEYGETHA